MIKSKFFRVAVEGQTTDGRVLTREDLEVLATEYDPEVYGARTWIEHLRSLNPEGDFAATGDVLALRTEEVTEGKLKGKLGLYAQFSPNKKGIDIAEKRTMAFWSIEMDPDFSDTNKPYFVGLAHTNSPASLGTEMMKFSANAELNPLAERKQRPENLFSSALELEGHIEFEEEELSKPSLFSRVKDLLNKKSDNDDQRFSDVNESVLAIAESQQALTEQVSKLGDGEDNEEHFTQLKEEVTELKNELESLKSDLDETPSNNYSSRPPATGGDGAELADC
ncbi:GPO family capsid scaffolding protein [Maricurvus nonylphenolicus]|uniref:GPO family capsid scaffolding protein n=1 Tax=Maricurvus nonylphenolicus TaxID=1008307 RepID=UPI0036F3DFC7